MANTQTITLKGITFSGKEGQKIVLAKDSLVEHFNETSLSNIVKKVFMDWLDETFEFSDEEGDGTETKTDVEEW